MLPKVATKVTESALEIGHIHIRFYRSQAYKLFSFHAIKLVELLMFYCRTINNYIIDSRLLSLTRSGRGDQATDLEKRIEHFRQNTTNSDPSKTLHLCQIRSSFDPDFLAAIYFLPAAGVLTGNSGFGRESAVLGVYSHVYLAPANGHIALLSDASRQGEISYDF